MPIKISALQKKQQVFFHYFTLTVYNIVEYSKMYVIGWVILIENFSPVSLWMASLLSISYRIYL